MVKKRRARRKPTQAEKEELKRLLEEGRKLGNKVRRSMGSVFRIKPGRRLLISGR